MSIKKAEMPSLACEALADLKEFAESGWDCAEVVEHHNKNVTTAYNNYKMTLRRHKDELPDITVSTKKGHLYLIRKDA